MKIYVFILLIMATIAIVLPMKDEDDWVLLDLLEMENKTESLESQLALSEEDGELRFNVLCKFLADGYNHKVCAIRCIFKGKRGGKCTEDGVCSCCKKSWFG